MTEIEIHVSAPADAVRQALRDPGEIRRWFGWDYPGLDEEIRLIFVDGTSEVDDRTLTIGEDRLTLETAGAGTVVRLSRTPPPDGGFDPLAEGWLTFLQQLRFALERHPGEDRRTVRVEGAGDASPVAALGLDGVAGRYDVAAATGETLAGELWFRSERQLGLTVESFGDGLLIVASEPGKAAAIVSTYGLDDGAFAAVGERWSSWWKAHYAELPEAVHG